MRELFKQTFARLANAFGLLKMLLGLLEAILRNTNYKLEIPTPQLANLIADNLDEAVEDGIITSNESADLLKLIKDSKIIN